MSHTKRALALGLAMIAISVLAIFGIVPEEFAQFAPALLLALFPGVWLKRGSRGEGRC